MFLTQYTIIFSIHIILFCCIHHLWDWDIIMRLKDGGLSMADIPEEEPPWPSYWTSMDGKCHKNMQPRNDVNIDSKYIYILSFFFLSYSRMSAVWIPSSLGLWEFTEKMSGQSDQY